MHTNPEHEGPQVTGLPAADPAPTFQAGHAGSIPVTRSRYLTSANAKGAPPGTAFADITFHVRGFIAERERGIANGH